ncbi:hypothetical protein D3C71_1847830 [compost metagenome]
MLDGTAADIDDIMAPRLIQPGDHFPALPLQLKLGFVAVIPRMLHAEHRFDLHICQFGITGKSLPHQLRLRPELALVRDMLNLAAAAAPEHRARRLNPVRRPLLDLG